MKIMKKVWVIPLLFTIIILTAIGFYSGIWFKAEKPLTEEEIYTELEEMYGGTVDSLSLKNDIYVAELTRSGALYLAKINAVTGKVLSIDQKSEMEIALPEVLSEEEIKSVIAKKYPGEVEYLSLSKEEDPPVYNGVVEHDQNLVTIVLNAFTGEFISEETKEIPVKNVLITREQAIKIALEQLQGDVDHVSFMLTDDGGYYLVEIEQEIEGKEEIDAVFQIHAITGEILSVEWDD